VSPIPTHRVNLFIAKAGGLDSESIPLVQKLIQ